MTDYLVDFSFQRPSADEVKAAGYVGVVSYLSNSPDKNWDGVLPDGTRQRPGEAASFLAAGLCVGMVWETVADRATQGYPAGFADAQAANACADAIGAPSTAAIYFAVDENVGYDAVRPYFEGAMAAKGRPCGSYGSQSVVEGFLADGGRYGWQVATWGDRSPQAHIFQEPNMASAISGTDVDSIQVADWGAWSSQQGGFLDVLTPEQQQAVFDRVTAMWGDFGAIETMLKAAQANTTLVAATLIGLLAQLDPGYPTSKSADAGAAEFVRLLKAAAAS